LAGFKTEPRSVVGWAMWWSWFLLQLAMAGLVGLAMVAAGVLLLAGISGIIAWFHTDALVHRRWPWLSWPLMIAFDGLTAWWVASTKLGERRLRRELPAKIKAWALRCPLCDGSLPVWGGAFEHCPIEENFRWGGWGNPEGCFRLLCDPCARDVWFVAWLDGAVRPHLGWMWENKYKFS
jgi:hypothetical protein